MSSSGEEEDEMSFESIVTDEEIIEQVLEWIGFTEPQRGRLAEEFSTLDDIREWTDKDVNSLEESFAKRTATEGKMYFGMAKKKKLKALVHWIKDFDRISEVPTIKGLNSNMFRAALQVAAERAEIRKQEAENSSTITGKATPGKLKSERHFTDWKNGFQNMLSTIPGVSGIPLSYIIRDNDEPIREGHQTFTQECIACAPLDGVAFESDARQVHHLVTASVQGENSEQWIKSLKKHQNGRKDMQALSDHFQGEGNTSRRISEAERIRDNLHYKSERALPFATFLAKLQLMFNIFSENNEPYTEGMKLRALFEKVQHPQLASAIQALKVQSNLDSVSLTYTKATNHIAAEVSKMPEYAANKRNVSALNSGGGAGSIYRDGKIFTGYHQNFKQLSKEDQDKVYAERERLGIKPKIGGRRGRGRAGTAKTKRQLAAVKKDLEKAKRQIAAIKSGNNETVSDDDSPNEDAGDAFGGRSERKNKKAKSG